MAETSRPPANNANSDSTWHQLPGEAVLQQLDSRTQGLDTQEAAARLDRHGPNRLESQPGTTTLQRLLRQFNNTLIYVLLAAAGITAAMGHWLDTQVILAVVLLNVVIGFLQENKAEKALSAISDMLAPKASVIRDGQRRSLPAAELVPGDIVLLESGARIPADLRLLEVKNLQVQEAALTGESTPVSKDSAPVDADCPLAERSSMGYASTLVTAGQGTGVVVATGADSEIGRIGRLLSEVQSLTTPLLRQMARFAHLLTFLILSLSGLVFLYGYFLRDYELATIFISVVSLTVAAIPEGLPTVLTITLAIGVQRMARRNAIIRHLPAVETLGALSVICSDKTGTLTRNEMTLRTLETADHRLEISGTGYEPDGAFHRNGQEVQATDHDASLEALRAGLLCSDSDLHEADEGWNIGGDPMEGALLVAAAKAGLDYGQERGRHPRLDYIPFDSGRRYMATLHRADNGQPVVYVKGAPERILEMCRTQLQDGQEEAFDPAVWHDRAHEMATAGQRVIAMARMTPSTGSNSLDEADLEQGLVFLGLTGLIDPPRDEALKAVAECREAGISVKMITGDHPATARAIAEQFGLPNTQKIVTGRDLDQLPEEELEQVLEESDVFARTTPENKLRLVEALQAQGRIVAMTGDGANDAPALKRADVGIAMGKKGTEAAREAAAMVLADDNFASIAHAVREGRTVYDNLKKAIAFLLPVNGGESLGIVIAILTGATMPVTPLQILWVNMVSSIGLALALAFEPTEPDVMKRPPRPASEPILSGFLAWRVLFVSLLFLLGIFGMFELAIQRGAAVEEARTLAINTLVVMEIFYLFSIRFLHRTSFSLQGLMGTPAVLLSVAGIFLLQLLFTYAPFMQTIFDTRPVDFHDGLLVIACGIGILVVLEVEKAVRRRMALHN
ncbi:cation-transporting P-type ATPase [Fodinicurvata fenggangensis]|uniref:cation-transporting P-type ATPase n=1 Tax=Fodinicurvata fenggangensis TaxID=1121830 RepID=UPI00047A50E3|nr:cation-transporting P-type ATPase [Fodinicurvata fenggangensis]